MALLVAAGLTAFFLTRGPEPTAPATAPNGEKAAPVEPAAPAGSAIETTAGTVFIEKAEISETWTPGCELGVDPMCETAAPGYKILVIWMTPGTADAEAASDAILDVYQDTTVTDSAGESTDGFAGGLLSGKLLIAFTPPEDAAGFTLNWPGNDPIPLDV